ncbi:MAG: hypothetical protein QM599_07505 [Pseudoxanthomonas sp.]
MPMKSLLCTLAAGLLLAACATAPVGRPMVTQGPIRASSAEPAAAPAPKAAPAPAPVCTDCGTVAHVETVAAGKAAGALGGIVGGVAGKPVAGQLAYNIHVRMDDGRSVVIRQDEAGDVRQGQRVRVVAGRLVVP